MMRSLPATAKWYRDRIAAMSFPETLHRVAELARKLSGYRFNRDWNKIPVKENLATLPELQSQWNFLSAELKGIVAEEAKKVRAGHFRFLGADWLHPTSMPPDPSFWQRFPDATLWPGHDAYCFNILARPKLDHLEVKHIWEINRLQFLVPMAVDARLRDDASGKKLILDLISSWMEGNKPYCGINWVSGIELALRIISVALAISILGLDRLDCAEKLKLERFFMAHVFWIARYPSLYSSANNHRIAELVGLLIGAIVVPKMTNAKHLKQQALADLINEIEKQILPDGIGAEQSLAYSAFMIELSLIAFCSLKLQRNDLPATTQERLGAWANHVQWMMTSAGQVPAIGDCDESKVITLTQEQESRYIASIVAAVAGYLERPDLAPTRTDDHLRDVLFNSISGQAPIESGIRTWDRGGYTVVRTRPVHPVVLIFDHGPVGYLSIAAHGHADTLGIWLSVGDKPVIIDAGTYVYNSNSIWRDQFRASALHNTLSIAGYSSSVSSGLFNWSTKAKAILLKAAQDPLVELVAQHDGYLNRFSVIHRRTIRLVNSSSMLVIDELIGAPIDEIINISFVIDPTCFARVEKESQTDVIVQDRQGDILRLSGNGVLMPCVMRGDEAAQLGWVSPTFGVRIPADQIMFRGVLGEPSAIRIDILQ
jgi:hypothetical protein